MTRENGESFSAAEIYERMIENANSFKNSARRLATIERLAESCNAIEDGTALALIKSLNKASAKVRLAINPTNIEKYVRARGKKDNSWTGPVRVTIASDELFSLYVRARERKREKPSLPHRPSKLFKRIDEALNEVLDPSIRQEIRFKIENGRLAKKELDLLKAGLKHLPSIDINAILTPDQAAVRELFSEEPRASSPPNNSACAKHLQAMLDRLTDPSTLSRFGLTIENDRIKSRNTNRPLIKPNEIQVLKHLLRSLEG